MSWNWNITGISSCLLEELNRSKAPLSVKLQILTEKLEEISQTLTLAAPTRPDQDQTIQTVRAQVSSELLKQGHLA